MPLIRRRAETGVSRRRRATPWVDPSYGDPRLAALRETAQGATAGQWPLLREQLDLAVDGEDLTWLVEGLAAIDGVESWIGEVVAAQPESALPLLVSGARHIEWAWQARTRKMAKYVSEEQFEVFHSRLRLAEDQLYEVAEREPGWVAPWYFLQIAGRGLQVGTRAAAGRFEAAVRRSPGHLASHRQQLQQVCDKWGGSHEQMHRFARESVLAAPAGGPLGELVAIAHLEQWLDDGAGGSAYMRSSAVILQLYEAAELSVHHPQYVRHRDWTRGFNTFALAFALAGESEAARDLFRVLDGSVTQFPWMYLDGQDPTVPFREWRSRCRG
ncbi:hypothetical protein OG552_29100 [Streptomyces sp. NBC_01476]|uniref:hypothetical protein n=1 Tax=Streptomyces sp. NBC_01476 TaxID=2903881 RepID=UPI002E360D83|nr:hypothetical protein [Streptomyces sp. NBC_01476]